MDATAGETATKFIPPPGEANERTMKREELAALHEREPWLTPDEAAARLLIPVVNLRIFTTELGIEWARIPEHAPAPPPIPAHRTLYQKVVAMHRMHPTWTAAMIAKELGASVNSVGSYLGTARREVAREQVAA